VGGAGGGGAARGQAYAAAYTQAKRAQGLVDFDDLIREARRLLETPGMGEWVRFKLDQQTDHILVDEAQDTNAAQWSIVDALAGEYFSGEGRSARHRTIFTVGDFKQAIFSFQGTDPAEFERARRRFSDAARALRDNASDLFNRDERLPPDFLDLSMDRSFRSAPQVLAAVDSVIAELGARAARPAAAAQSPCQPHAEPAGAVTLWRPFSAERGEARTEGEEGLARRRRAALRHCLARQVAGVAARPADARERENAAAAAGHLGAGAAARAIWPG
jgi:ATP-dependent helicase/nuclease subunit A